MKRPPLFLLLALFALDACGLRRDAQEAVQRRTEEAQAAIAKPQGAPIHLGTVTVHEGIWVGGRSVVKANGDPLPRASESAKALVLNSMGVGLDLKEIATEVTAQTGLKVVVEDHLDGPPAASPAGARGRGSSAATRTATRP